MKNLDKQMNNIRDKKAPIQLEIYDLEDKIKELEKSERRKGVIDPTTSSRK